MRSRPGKRVLVERLKEVLRYEPETGNFYRLSGPDKGKVAGTKALYIQIKVDDVLCYGHHLAWVYMTGEWPTKEVDHRDTVKHNNRWLNLRLATSSQQKQNAPVSNKPKTSRYKGVFWLKGERKWVVKISVNRRCIYIGRFRDEDIAYAAYCAAAKKHFGEFARAA